MCLNQAQLKGQGWSPVRSDGHGDSSPCACVHRAGLTDALPFHVHPRAGAPATESQGPGVLVRGTPAWGSD